MRVSLALIVFAACLALCACAQSSCTAMITFKARADSSWNVGTTRYQIYDITVTNNGSCALTSIIGIFSFSAGGFISESWNYGSSSGTFSGYGSVLNAGQSFYGAGFVLANASMPMLSAVHVGCPDSCYSSPTTSHPTTVAPTTVAPTTTAPTTTKPSTAAPTTAAPTTAAPTTAAPTTATPTTTKATTAAPTTAAPTTTAPTTTAPKTCTVTASVTRDSYWWMDAQGRNNSVYRLSITNAGPCALQYFTISFNIGSGTILSYWNLQTSIGGYLVTGYGPALQAGATFNAAGMILANAPDHIAITPYGSSCAC